MPRCIDRMGGEIETEGVASGGHALGDRPRSIARQADRRGLCGIGAKQSRLTADPLVVRACRVGEDRLGRGEYRGALGLDAVERTGGGEAFELAAVQQPRIDASSEILETGERPAALALLDQRFHRLLADALERSERVANGSVVDREESMTRV